MNDTEASRWGLRLIAVVLAVLLWLFVTNQNIIGTRQTVAGVKVQTVNAGPGLKANAPDSIDVEVIGKSNNPSSYRAVVDLTGLAPGKHEVPVKVEGPPGTRIVKTIPARVTVNLVRINEKMVPVHVVVTANPPEGYRVTGTLPSPAQAIVRGTYQDISRVQSVKAQLDLAQQKESQRLPVTFVAVDNRMQEVDNVAVSPSSGEVYVLIEEDLVNKQVPVQVKATGTPAAGVQVGTVSINPQVVTAVGPATLLKNLSVAAAESVDVTGLDRTFVKQVPLVPESGIVFYPSTVTVQVELRSETEGNVP